MSLPNIVRAPIRFTAWPFPRRLLLGNLPNGTRAQQDLIFAHPSLLNFVPACMVNGKLGVRSPLVPCVLSLFTSNPRRRQEFVNAGFMSTLRHFYDGTVGRGRLRIIVIVTGTSAKTVGSTQGTSPSFFILMIS